MGLRPGLAPAPSRAARVFDQRRRTQRPISSHEPRRRRWCHQHEIMSRR